MQRRYRRRKPKPKTGAEALRVNERIRIPTVQVIDEEGKNLGEISTNEALAKARDAGLDLVEVNPKANPSIAKIIDFSTYKYQQEKRERKAKAAQKKSEIKGLRLSFRIKGQDLELRKNQARKFLGEGHKVKIEMVLRGRERAHREQAVDNMKEFTDSLEDAKIIQPLSRQGGRLSMVIGK